MALVSKSPIMQYTMALRNWLMSLLFLIPGGLNCIAQAVEKLKVSVLSPENGRDGLCTYTISIKNSSDTTVCILHSLFLNLTSDKPKGLALNPDGNANKYDCYSLRYSMEDTLHEFESLPYLAECILPYQTLKFKIVMRKIDDKKEKNLTLSM